MLFLGLAAGSGGAQAPGSSSSPEPRDIPSPELHNLFRVADRIFSGSRPESEAAFAHLKELGVTTVISVDGARPDLEAARRHELRYVHLPIGYDGIPTNRWTELMVAARDSTGAVYVHCHHGKHRGPAAAAVLGLATGGWSTNQALAWMERAGTSPDYAGLFRSVARFRAPDPAALAAVAALPEVTAASSLVEAMLAIDRHADLLKEARRARWREIPGHPDGSPRHEGTQLWEAFRELNRPSAPLPAGASAGYRAALQEAEQWAEGLLAELRRPQVDPEAAEAAWRRVAKSCVDCHREYRD